MLLLLSLARERGEASSLGFYYTVHMSPPGQSSRLSDSKYGYDLVVATTQASINSTMLNYMSGMNAISTKAVYVADSKGKPVYMDYHDLLTKAHGSDPFNIDTNAVDFDPTMNKDCQNLVRARFMFGFVRAQSRLRSSQTVGLPLRFSSLIQIVELNARNPIEHGPFTGSGRRHPRGRC